MSMGGGRGNGAGFAPEDMDEFKEMREKQGTEGNADKGNGKEMNAADGDQGTAENENQQRDGSTGENGAAIEEAVSGNGESAGNEMLQENGATLPEGVPPEGTAPVNLENPENGIPTGNTGNQGDGVFWGDASFQPDGMPPGDMGNPENEIPQGDAPIQQNGMSPDGMGAPGSEMPQGDASFQPGGMPPEGMENSGNEIPTEDMENPGTEMADDILTPTEDILQGENETAENPTVENDISQEETENIGDQTPGNAGEMRDGKMKDGPGGMSRGSDDVSLIYTDDEYDSYSNIFDSAKTEITDRDKDRLIASLKALNEGTDIENVVNVEEVIRYFVVHNFVCNFDSYTGSMIHNYYLYEKDGQFSMIPWDYNLAFGGFESGTDAQSLVNYPIDSPVSGGTIESRPMLAWIFADEEYTELYHQYFAEFVEQYFTNGEFENMMNTVSEMIAPYVEKDPTKFCTYEEFQEGVSTLKSFCALRAESIQGQLDGTVSATESSKISDSEEQTDENVVEASNLSIAAMGTMGNGFGRGGGPGETLSETESPSEGNAMMPKGFQEGNLPRPEDSTGENMPAPGISREEICLETGSSKI